MSRVGHSQEQRICQQALQLRAFCPWRKIQPQKQRDSFRQQSSSNALPQWQLVIYLAKRAYFDSSEDRLKKHNKPTERPRQNSRKKQNNYLNSMSYPQTQRRETHCQKPRNDPGTRANTKYIFIISISYQKGRDMSLRQDDKPIRHRCGGGGNHRIAGKEETGLLPNWSKARPSREKGSKLRETAANKDGGQDEKQPLQG
ncbi:MAG: hypothetical protein AB1413_04785 [Thermodesulfobacteriota bacterium]